MKMGTTGTVGSEFACQAGSRCSDKPQEETGTQTNADVPRCSTDTHWHRQPQPFGFADHSHAVHILMEKTQIKSSESSSQSQLGNPTLPFVVLLLAHGDVTENGMCMSEVGHDVNTTLRSASFNTGKRVALSRPLSSKQKSGPQQKCVRCRFLHSVNRAYY